MAVAPRDMKLTLWRRSRAARHDRRAGVPELQVRLLVLKPDQTIDRIIDLHHA